MPSSFDLQHYRNSVDDMRDSDEEGDAYLAPPLTMHLSAPAIAPSSATIPPSSSARRRARSPQSEADSLNSASRPKRVAVGDNRLIGDLLRRLAGLEVAFKAQNDQLNAKIAEQDSRIAVQDERITTQEEKVSKAQQGRVSTHSMCSIDNYSGSTA